MPTKLKLGKQSKITVSWKVLPVDYSREKEQNIIETVAKKYNVGKEMVSVEPMFISMKNGRGDDLALTNDTIENIQEPKFQHELFKEWLVENDIKDYDFDRILEIDERINGLIDYDVYEKFKRYEIKWIRWDNFLSYGKDNYFDFTSLKGLVLLNGEPANQSGKSTFAYDLLHFLLFGKTSSGKADVLSDIFNRYSPEETEVKVEGCICIDNEDYIIRRTLSRPALKRRSAKSKVTQKVEYFRVTNGMEEVLEDVDNLEGNGNVQTSQIIKQAIGNEKDFDLVICANSDNLKSLISLKDTERGRLLSKWIGLLPLEEKDSIAREKWNKEISPSLVSNLYNRETVRSDIDNIKSNIKDMEDDIKKNNKIIHDADEKLKGYNQTYETLLSSKKDIDGELTKVDVNTIEMKMNGITEKGKRTKQSIAENKSELEAIKDVEFSLDEYNRYTKIKEGIIVEIAGIKSDINHLREQNTTLKKSEYCPTCGRKLENVDYSDRIKENEEKVKLLIENGVNKKSELETVKSKIDSMEDSREKFNKKNKLEILIQKLEVDLENLSSSWRENNRILKDIKSNKDAIENNNRIDASINVIKENIKTEEGIKQTANSAVIIDTQKIDGYKESISNMETIIENIEKEEIMVKHWKLYLSLVGKNGISKMVLRKTLPLINGELKRLLNGVTDFDVDVTIDERNDVAFNIIREGVVQSLSSGSGFEQTAASLALRVVLGNISTLSRPSFILLDEVLGGVAKENYENIKLLYDRIAKDYSFIFQITHLSDIVDWHDSIVTITKKNNISSIGEVKN